MEIVFVAITKTHGGVFYTGIPNAIRCAQARSGCRVWFISDSDVPCDNPLPLHRYWTTSQSLISSTTEQFRSKSAIQSLYRWCVVHDFARSQKWINWPILALDYDVLTFSNMPAAYGMDILTGMHESPQSLMDCDFSTFIMGVGTPAAYGVHNPACLTAGVEKIFELAKTTESLNDMAVWSEMFRSGKWRCGDLTPEQGGGVFDPSMHDGQNRYVMEPASDPVWGRTTKHITWKDGNPHFTRSADNQLVRAHWLHCWGSYKFRTGELVKAAGL